MPAIFKEGMLIDEAEQQLLGELKKQYRRFTFLDQNADEIEHLLELAVYDDLLHNRPPRYPEHQTYMDYYMIYATEKGRMKHRTETGEENGGTQERI